MSTYATKAKDVQRRWFLVDADGETLGRLASEVAYLLRGKHNPMYVPYLDTGDHVVVVNASRIRVTGRKLEDKYYFRHTGYPGGARTTTLSVRLQKEPGEVIRDAVKGMLPKGPLGRQMLRKLKVYDGPEHKQEAQQPVPYELGKGGKAVPAAE
ncbi:MAG: 50S ribosomal protein L13 [Candidatus Eisenbacteria bacterium]|uniref:Large ribosomal subunit protein uL13 n=1 Tax=Eiseniibacteriota bacterium TaxID=2212470 RepID=A0A956N8J7_UNCEI|nr:50S ribosomal protein L13 [Candidatus Eisenbacteria bacterium]MCB9462965.1 50S ribosomal protein L13 [Candidatus Eisenbacteria bacterium]